MEKLQSKFQLDPEFSERTLHQKNAPRGRLFGFLSERTPLGRLFVAKNNFVKRHNKHDILHHNMIFTQ